VLELDHVEGNLLLHPRCLDGPIGAKNRKVDTNLTASHRGLGRVLVGRFFGIPTYSNTSNREKPEVLISSVPTVKRAQEGFALAVPVGNKMGQRPKGSGEHSIAGKGGQKRNYLAYDRQGKMHMVKVKLLKLQPKAE
jgi:hypothetical protein